MLKTNGKIEQAQEFIFNTSANVFLTGKAGTGKTTFLREIVRRSPKRTIVAAPTGIAALNAQGVTLHSLFQLPFGIHIPNAPRPRGQFKHRLSKRKLSLIRSIELLVIDEVSMVRSDMLDAVDQVLRTVRRTQTPFGGVQLLLIGDIQQLSPICADHEWELLREHYRTPYFFDSQALQKIPYVMVEFDQIFRQSDSKFTKLLNAVRENNISDAELEELNKRHIPNFQAPDNEDYITLTTHNNTANKINRDHLAALNSQAHFFDAKVKGDFQESAYPNDMRLELKVGAQVLFIKNDVTPEKRYYNGLIGRITSIENSKIRVAPKSGGEEIEVEPVAWDSIEYNIDPLTGAMEENVKGSFSQLPLKCAWAITIHKSQGLSFDRAIIDASASFAHGQVYVALSRCRTLEGLVLRSPLRRHSIIGESEVQQFSAHVTANQPDEQILKAYKRHFYHETLRELFSFDTLHKKLWELWHESKTGTSKEYPLVSIQLGEMLNPFDENVVRIGKSFANELTRAVCAEEGYEQSEHIAERLAKAADYFTPRFESTAEIVRLLKTVEYRSKERKLSATQILSEVSEDLALTISALQLCKDGFNLHSYLQLRATHIAKGQMAAEPEAKKKVKSEKKSTLASNSTTTQKEPQDHNEELLKALKAWRYDESNEIKKPAYVVFPDATLLALAIHAPKSIEELGQIKGIGPKKIEQYGDQLLEIIGDY